MLLVSTVLKYVLKTKANIWLKIMELTWNFNARCPFSSCSEESKPLKGGFTWTNVTSNSVVVNWNSSALIDKGTELLIFAAITNEPTGKPQIFSSNVESETLTIDSLEPDKTYFFTVMEDSLSNPAVEIGIFEASLTGNYVCQSLKFQNRNDLIGSGLSI